MISVRTSLPLVMPCAGSSGLSITRSPGLSDRSSLPSAFASPVTSHLSRSFEDCRDALAAADAHGDERVLPADALQLVERLHREHRSGRADGMAQTDRAAVGVGLLRIELEVACDRERLHRERLVRLDDVHLLDLEPGLLERLLRGRHRAYAHDLGVDARQAVG